MNTIRLRHTIAQHLGKVLTPELAADIEVAAYPDAGDDYAGRFAPVVHGGYTIAVERMAGILPELHALHLRHWRETERHRHGIPMDPDYGSMLEAEADGRLLQFTARSADGALAGNLRMFIRVSRHTCTRYAEEDTLFMAPEHRGGLTVLALMRYAEHVLLQLGVREIRANSKLVNRADVLMRRMGYEPVATQFVKFFEGGAANVQ